MTIRLRQESPELLQLLRGLYVGLPDGYGCLRERRPNSRLGLDLGPRLAPPRKVSLQSWLAHLQVDLLQAAARPCGVTAPGAGGDCSLDSSL